MSKRSFIIRLEDVRLFGRHGVFPQEREIGNEFRVDLAVTFYVHDPTTRDDLNSTVSYVDLFELVKKEMKNTASLMETVAVAITDRITTKYRQVEKVQLKITKLHPPIANFEGMASVEYFWER